MSASESCTLSSSSQETQVSLSAFDWPCVSVCALWQCPICAHRRHRRIIYEECPICANEVPQQSFMHCPTCAKRSCVLCRLQVLHACHASSTVAALRRARCCFCRQPCHKLDVGYLELVYEAHKDIIPFELWHRPRYYSLRSWDSWSNADTGADRSTQLSYYSIVDQDSLEDISTRATAPSPTQQSSWPSFNSQEESDTTVHSREADTQLQTDSQTSAKSRSSSSSDNNKPSRKVKCSGLKLILSSFYSNK